MEVNKGHREIIADSKRRSSRLFPQEIETLVGVDEAGRGPLAGPVAVGTVVFKKAKEKDLKRFLKDFPYGKDSKKMSEKERECWYQKIQEGKREGLLNFKVSFSSSLVIDKKGIVGAINLALKNNLDFLKVKPEKTLIKLDGGLKASQIYPSQETIIKGDEKELIVSLASIAAKVERDLLMRKLSKKYPQYFLDIHKGYGTKKHREVLKNLGPSLVHRRSFCRPYLQGSNKVLN